MFSALIVGAGKYGGGSNTALPDNHANLISWTPNICLVACVDPVMERGRNLGNQHHADFFPTLSEALKESYYDVISVVTPDYEHYDAALTILQCGRPPRILIIEKPVCLDVNELRELQIAAQGTGTLVITNNKYRLNNSLNSLRTKIAKGQYGPIAEVRAHYYGSWARNGSHMIDLLVFLTGQIPQIRNIKRQVSFLNPEHVGPSVNGILGGGGPPFWIDWFDESAFQIFELDIRFSRGRVRVENFGRDIATWKTTKNLAGEIELDAGRQFDPPVEVGSMNIYRHVVDYLKAENLGILKYLTLKDQEITISTLAEVDSFMRGDSG